MEIRLANNSDIPGMIELLKQVGEGLLTGATGLVAAISDVVIGLIFSIYVLAGKEKLNAKDVMDAAKANDPAGLEAFDQYTTYLAMGMEEDWSRWEEYLLLAMGSCTGSYEMLPLVQDKDILDNVLYSGVWTRYRKREEGDHDRGSL
mgnify:CR=1 FL=1